MSGSTGTHRDRRRLQSLGHRGRAILSTTGVSLVAAGVAFVVNILMGRQLGPASRGDVAFVLQASYVVAPALALGIDRQALRGTDALRGVPRSLHVWVVAAVAAGIAAAAGSLVALACIGAAASSAYISIERGAGMARRSLLSFVVVALALQTWIFVASVALFLGSVDDVRWWLGVYVAPGPVLLVIDVARSWWRRHDGPFLRPSRTSAVYMAGGIAALLAGRVERLILPVVSSSRELGLYMAVATASEMIVWGARGLGESRVQDYVTGTVTRRALVRLAARDTVWFSLASVPVAGILFGVVLPLLGPGFADSRVLVVPLCAASTAWCVYLQLSARWLGGRSSWHSMALDLSAAALTAVMVVALAPGMGALGAGLACLTSYSVMVVVAIVLFRPPGGPPPD